MGLSSQKNKSKKKKRDRDFSMTLSVLFLRLLLFRFLRCCWCAAFFASRRGSGGAGPPSVLRLLGVHHEHRTGGLFDHVLRYRAQKHPLELSHSPRAHHYYVHTQQRDLVTQLPLHLRGDQQIRLDGQTFVRVLGHHLVLQIVQFVLMLLDLRKRCAPLQSS